MVDSVQAADPWGGPSTVCGKMSRPPPATVLAPLPRLGIWRRVLTHSLRCGLGSNTAAAVKSRRIRHDVYLSYGCAPSSPPDDETVKQWMREHRTEKYG